MRAIGVAQPHPVTIAPTRRPAPGVHGRGVVRGPAAPTRVAVAARLTVPVDGAGTLGSGAEGFAETVGRLLALSLGAFAQAGQRLGIRVPWDPEPLWFVPTPEDANTVTADEGVNPGRIWTASALRQLLAAGITPEGARWIAQTRVAFETEDVVISPPRPTAAPSPTHEQLTLEAR
jgi:hypothetical protein